MVVIFVNRTGLRLRGRIGAGILNKFHKDIPTCRPQNLGYFQTVASKLILVNKRLPLYGLLMDQRLLALGEIETELAAVHAYDGEILFFFRGSSDGEAFDLEGLNG
jgi:hypothetical protein